MARGTTMAPLHTAAICLAALSLLAVCIAGNFASELFTQRPVRSRCHVCVVKIQIKVSETETRQAVTVISVHSISMA